MAVWFQVCVHSTYGHCNASIDGNIRFEFLTVATCISEDITTPTLVLYLRETKRVIEARAASIVYGMIESPPWQVNVDIGNI